MDSVLIPCPSAQPHSSPAPPSISHVQLWAHGCPRPPVTPLQPSAHPRFIPVPTSPSSPSTAGSQPWPRISPAPPAPFTLQPPTITHRSQATAAGGTIGVTPALSTLSHQPHIPRASRGGGPRGPQHPLSPQPALTHTILLLLGGQPRGHGRSTVGTRALCGAAAGSSCCAPRVTCISPACAKPPLPQRAAGCWGTHPTVLHPSTCQGRGGGDRAPGTPHTTPRWVTSPAQGV